jgi:hypothetical protein
MTALELVARYYDAWQNKRGDFSEVPLAEDFRFIGPVASFETAEGYWEMAMPGLGKLTSAEVLEVADGTIVRGELIYDAERLRRAMVEA